ncbi:copper-activated transcription factor grisea [Histoplasma ohiense]|nr:copper-activated transcription factor grisea [Histoplasma ohiense (nom. inval.)]
MPLDEEGAKWSCEPCVRGHRSSKCQHFDRLMMKVPKAGRPLAKCPHPKGTCSCQKLYAFMVRIPKGSTCLCRPLYQVPMVVTEAGPSEQPASVPPVSIVPTISGRNRPQKRSRRQSSLQTAPELVTKSSSPTDPKCNGNNGAMDHGANPTTSSVQSPCDEQYLEPLPRSTEFPLHQTPSGGFNPHRAYPTQSQCQPLTNRTGVQSSTNGGCCDAQTTNESSTKPHQSSGSPKSLKLWQYNDTTPQFKLEETSPSDRPVAQSSVHFAPHYRSASERRPFSTIDVEKRDHNQDNTPPNFPHRNSFANSRLHETSSVPVTGYSSPNTMSPYRSTIHPIGDFPCSGMNDLGFQTNHIPDDSHPHNCDCGDDCQCLGCASHPYNNTTRQYIQQMGCMITSRGPDQNPESKDNVRPPFDNHVAHNTHFNYGHGWPPNNFPFHLPDWNGSHPGPSFNNPSSSAAAPAVYDPNQDQVMMQPAAYYELEYPVGMLDSCTNTAGTCKCGVNCSCVGCLTHNGHDGIPLELSQPQDSQAERGPSATETSSSTPDHAGQPAVYTSSFGLAPPTQSPIPITPTSQL